MNACSLHALYIKECAVAENAIFLEIAPPWTKKADMRGAPKAKLQLENSDLGKHRQKRERVVAPEHKGSHIATFCPPASRFREEG